MITEVKKMMCEFNDEAPCVQCGMYCNIELQRETNTDFCDGECLCAEGMCKYDNE